LKPVWPVRKTFLPCQEKVGLSVMLKGYLVRSGERMA